MANLSNNKNILIIGEFPVIHKGYADFFNKILKKEKQAHFYLGFLDNKIIKKMTKLEPDIRKISALDCKKIIKSFFPIKKFFTLSGINFEKLIKGINPEKIIILKGDKSESFAGNYLNSGKYKKIVQYYDIRLRWKSGNVTEFKKENSRLSKKELKIHQKFMNEAIKQAKDSKCWWRQVGAVLVKNRKIILKSFNKMMPTDDECYKIGCIRDEIEPGKLPEICSVAHSESIIISVAASEGISLKNATMYVTHFPCPACSKLVALSGIKKMVYSRGSSVFDGERVMKSRGVDIIKISC